MSEIETLWQTYDFILNKIVTLEDEMTYLLDKNITINDKSFNKKLQELINSYNKQLFTIQEIKSFCEKNPEEISEERQVALGTLEELEQVTEELKIAMLQNMNNKLED